jgi:hypothetical protein
MMNRFRAQFITMVSVVVTLLATTAVSAASLEGALDIIEGEGFSVREADDIHQITWRRSGEKKWALVALDDGGNGRAEISIFSVIDDAKSKMSPSLVNQINAEKKFIKLYIHEGGDGLIERYEVFLKKEDNDTSLAVRMIAALMEIGSISDKIMSSFGTTEPNFQKAAAHLKAVTK